jgi:hypothetical protein
VKQRTGFVSNSSSSSFIIFKRFLTPEQVDQIKDHQRLGKEWKLDWPEDYWNIYDHPMDISGYTTMDNFDMNQFLDLIGVDPQKITWEYD